MTKYLLTWEGNISGESYIDADNKKQAKELAIKLGNDYDFKEIDCYNMIVKKVEEIK